MSRRRRLTFSLAALVVTATTVVLLVVAGPACSQPPNAREQLGGMAASVTACDYSVLTAHNDNRRTGAQMCERVLTPLTAPYVQKAAQFAAGKVAGQPLLLHGSHVNGVVQDALFVVGNPSSQGGTPVLYALNPATLASIIQTNLPPAPSCTSGGCFGVLSTPVIDKTANPPLLYLVALVKDASNVLQYSLMAYEINTLSLKASATFGQVNGTCVNSSTGETFTRALARQPHGAAAAPAPCSLARPRPRLRRFWVRECRKGHRY